MPPRKAPKKKLEDGVSTSQAAVQKSSKRVKTTQPKNLENEENRIGGKNSDKNQEIINLLNSAFLVSHPTELLKFFEWASTLLPISPKDAFKNFGDCELSLIGPFDLISNSVDYSKENCHANFLTHSRYSTDLPEMQTLMTWKTSKKSGRIYSQPLLINVTHNLKDLSFPQMDFIGDSNLFNALYHLINSEKLNYDNLIHFFPRDELITLSEYSKKLQDLKKLRKKKSIGEPLHGLRIKVDIKNDIGYRPFEDNKAGFQEKLKTMASTKDDQIRRIGNDEMDFGMGLEFGHDLFYSNYECFDGMAKSVLETAYQCLDRKPFAQILQSHYQRGRHNLKF